MGILWFPGKTVFSVRRSSEFDWVPFFCAISLWSFYSELQQLPLGRVVVKNDPPHRRVGGNVTSNKRMGCEGFRVPLLSLLPALLYCCERLGSLSEMLHGGSGYYS